MVVTGNKRCNKCKQEVAPDGFSTRETELFSTRIHLLESATRSGAEESGNCGKTIKILRFLTHQTSTVIPTNYEFDASARRRTVASRHPSQALIE